jgi:hypothetical protein
LAPHAAKPCFAPQNLPPTLTHSLPCVDASSSSLRVAALFFPSELSFSCSSTRREQRSRVSLVGASSSPRRRPSRRCCCVFSLLLLASLGDLQKSGKRGKDTRIERRGSQLVQGFCLPVPGHKVRPWARAGTRTHTHGSSRGVRAALAWRRRKSALGRRRDDSEG